jgi:hypothetical protein
MAPGRQGYPTVCLCSVTSLTLSCETGCELPPLRTSVCNEMGVGTRRSVDLGKSNLVARYLQVRDSQKQKLMVGSIACS